MFTADDGFDDARLVSELERLADEEADDEAEQARVWTAEAMVDEAYGDCTDRDELVTAALNGGDSWRDMELAASGVYGDQVRQRIAERELLTLPRRRPMRVRQRGTTRRRRARASRRSPARAGPDSDESEPPASGGDRGASGREHPRFPGVSVRLQMAGICAVAS